CPKVGSGISFIHMCHRLGTFTTFIHSSGQLGTVALSFIPVSHRLGQPRRVDQLFGTGTLFPATSSSLMPLLKTATTLLTLLTPISFPTLITMHPFNLMSFLQLLLATERDCVN